MHSKLTSEGHSNILVRIKVAPMKALITLFILFPIVAFGGSSDCLTKAKVSSVARERQWIKKNELASAEEIKSVVVARNDDGKDSTWLEHTPKDDMYGIFVESKKTDDNTHWEILMNARTCSEIGSANRKNAP